MTLSRLEVNCQAYNAAITACEKNANWQVRDFGRKDWGIFLKDQTLVWNWRIIECVE